MFRVDLVALERSGRLPVEGGIPASDPLWEGSELPLRGTVKVKGEMLLTGTGQVLFRGALEAGLAPPCRRCLETAEVELHLPLDLVWTVPDELGEEDGELRTLDPLATELDVGEVFREELILAAPHYPLCRPECQGLCPRCGANRNEVTCDCTLEEPDPRWEALRALKNE